MTTAVRCGVLCLLACLTLASCATQHTHKATMRRVFDELWTRGDLSVAEDTLTPNYTWRENANETTGRQEYKTFVAIYRGAFPDLSFEIEHILAEGNLVAVRWIAHGTHTGDLNGLPPTQRKVRVAGTTITRMDAGRAAEEWTTWDEAGMLRQLGLLP